MYVTRIAPSPTGMFHVGTARTALFNWLMAKASGGKFILRIDDTDAARNDPAAVKVIFDAMDWLGLDFDETFSQSDHIANSLYTDCGMALREDGLADFRDEDFVDGRAPLRLKAIDLPDHWNDEIKGAIKITDSDRKLCDGLVLVRSDGAPTYHFASMIDDLFTGVNLVIRGVDHVSNTVKQLAIAEALRKAALPWALTPGPKFAHLGLIEHIDPLDGKRKKISKRDAGSNIMEYRDAGVHPDAMFNFLLRLGWSPSDANFDAHTPWVTRERAIEMFATAGRMKNSPVLLDPKKLASLDRKIKAAG